MCRGVGTKQEERGSGDLAVAGQPGLGQKGRVVPCLNVAGRDTGRVPFGKPLTCAGDRCRVEVSERGLRNDDSRPVSADGLSANLIQFVQ